MAPLPLSTHVVNTVVQHLNGHWLLLHCPNCKTYAVSMHPGVKEIDCRECGTCGEMIYYFDGRIKGNTSARIFTDEVPAVPAVDARALQGMEDE